MNKNISDLNIAFFGSPQIAVCVLDTLKENGIIPSLIITQPDKPAGRKLKLTPPEAKVWAEKKNVSVFQPETLKDKNVIQAITDEGPWDIFIVVAYGKIIPRAVLGIPKHGTLNVHPSLLPKLRGASPLQSAILEENETGVSIMLVDEKMDHGPILAQEKTPIENWPPKASELEKMAGVQGGKMLAEIIPKWVTDNIKPQEQDHSAVTFTQKITKQDGLIDLDDDPEKNFRKIQAFDIWPRTYFFTERNGKKIRVIITNAEFTDGKLIIKKVIPEGKKETDYNIFVKS
ncbi:MAG: methionyl-tRNA formyltransferase [Candidatus Pacebacteria bacterium]|nr:methionyl-tRNA formyltransferase [Candidatus Paceibacterota bacterium]